MRNKPDVGRFEAIVIASGDAPQLPELRPVVEQLLDAGMTLAVIACSDAGWWRDLEINADLAHRLCIVARTDAALTATHDVELALSDKQSTFQAVIHELWRRGIAPNQVGVLAPPGASIPFGVVSFDGAARNIVRVLEDQLERRRVRELPTRGTMPGWALVVPEFDDGRERVRDALLALANGRIGVGGSALGVDAASPPWMVAAGVYDGDGPETYLLTGPVMAPIRADIADGTRLRRVLDLHAGVLHEELEIGSTCTACTRFVSKARPAIAAARLSYPGSLPTDGALLAPVDIRPYDADATAHGSWIRIAASSGGIAAATVSDRISPGPAPSVLDQFVTYESDADRLPDPSAALAGVREAKKAGFDQLLAEHREVWARRWEDADIVIEGDDDLQFSTRFALFQLMASVGDGPEAAVGARGLSGFSYRGHVFWDADTFALPFFAATHPASARAMLEYRIRRLPAARETATQLSRRGARFPWESARSGRDVTPSSARDRAGRVVPIRTGLLEEHITAEVAWAACCYVDWTGDDEFANGPCLTLLVETARYWASRIRLEPNGAHIYGVIGPDEYHEPVDDNAFTNVMARWNLRRALDAVAAAPVSRHGVSAEERRTWSELADALIDGYDTETGIYEQFAGFGRLEPLIIEDVAPRRPIAADLLLGAERVRRSQVIKQADVVMLHHLVPNEVVPGTLEPNLRYYEPRTAHGSSLSPAIHASLFARARDFPHALEALRIASHIDLEDLTGTTAGGLHIATMGGLWQALVFGFAGVRPRGGRLEIDPHLPPDWTALEVRVRFRGSLVTIRAEHGHLTVSADPPAPVTVGASPFDAGAAALDFRRRGPSWEMTT